MLKFKLAYDNFRNNGTSDDVLCVHSWDEHVAQVVQKEIVFFNEEIEWDGMFDLGIARDRILSGMTLYVLLIDNEPVGHVWLRDECDGRFLFNLFVRNKVATKTWSGKEFVSTVIDRFERGRTIYCEVDEWNSRSIRLFMSLGFERYIE